MRERRGAPMKMTLALPDCMDERQGQLFSEENLNECSR